MENHYSTKRLVPAFLIPAFIDDLIQALQQDVAFWGCDPSPCHSLLNRHYQDLMYSFGARKERLSYTELMNETFDFESRLQKRNCFPLFF